MIPMRTTHSALAGKPEQHHIPVLDYVVFAFRPCHPLLARRLPATQAYEVAIGDRLRSDESLFEVRVDHPRRRWRLIPPVYRPGAYLLLAGGEIAVQAEQVIGGVSQAV